MNLAIVTPFLKLSEHYIVISCTIVGRTVLDCRCSFYRIQVADVSAVMDLHLRQFLLMFLIFTLPETNIAPENRQSQKQTKIPTYSNHPSSGSKC